MFRNVNIQYPTLFLILIALYPTLIIGSVSKYIPGSVNGKLTEVEERSSE